MEFPTAVRQSREAAEAAAELDDLGFTALWIPDAGGPVLDSVDLLLASTKQVVIATGILNLWMHEPSDVAARYASLTKTYGDRFLLGIGCSNAALVDSGEPGRYRKPWPPRGRSSTPWTPPSSRSPSRTRCSRHSARRAVRNPCPRRPSVPRHTRPHP
jgi:hypothetical protein